ncbi:hypothetical protein MPDQ_002012 [Monascus purpureus]|uniref:Uncharacterized protein n=1 Tax=Monascus purpureus TaxID=5098 RepID=A0A507R0M4_MONPU|nr:hypothetical protein MPDQ_002012 [Monascus purpureus]
MSSSPNNPKNRSGYLIPPWKMRPWLKWLGWLNPLLIPCFFTFIVSFCGVAVPYQAMTHFWKWWMYWLTPFHYLLEGLLGLIMHEAPVRCIEREEAFADGDQFAQNFNVSYSSKWRDYGIFWGYVVFNFIVFLFSWGYLHGVQKLTKRISKWKTRKSRKGMKI